MVPLCHPKKPLCFFWGGAGGQITHIHIVTCYINRLSWSCTIVCVCIWDTRSLHWCHVGAPWSRQVFYLNSSISHVWKILCARVHCRNSEVPKHLVQCPIGSLWRLQPFPRRRGAGHRVRPWEPVTEMITGCLSIIWGCNLVRPDIYIYSYFYIYT